MVFPRCLVATLLLLVSVGCSSRAKEEERIGHPWFGAARIGDLQAMETQLTAGAAVDQASSAGTTALHVAALNGNVKVVRWLLEKGADVNRLDNDKTDALGYALSGATTGPKLGELVEILIKAGGNPFHQSAIGFIAIEEMVERGLADQLRLLSYTDKKQCDRMPSRGRDGLTLSQIARKSGQSQIAEFLESQGCW